jgi:hypothetical protein
MDDDVDNYDYYDEGQQEEQIDQFEEEAVPQIEEIIATQRVVTEREVKIRLEDRFFPWVTGRALKTMVDSGVVLKQGLAGRRGKIETKNFYSLPDFRYDDILGLMREKRAVSKEINAMLTGHAPATYFAEDLFERAFEALGFDIVDRDASKYEERRVVGVRGKEPPNVDFIMKRDGVIYGADIKNWLRYEITTREEVKSKVSVALQLGVVPFILARYVDKATIFKEIVEKGGICYPYRTLIVSPRFETLARDAIRVLGYPVIALDRLPAYKVKHIDFLHKNHLRRQRA